MLHKLFRRKPRIEQSNVTEALARRFGQIDENVGHASIPLPLGGASDVAWFDDGAGGVVCATTDLVADGSQKPNVRGNYELVIITESKDDFAANLISQLARYTFDVALETGQTMDINDATPEGSTIAALYFEALEPLKIQHVQIELLLCFAITSAELDHYRSGDEANLIQTLEEKGIFPVTSWKRPSIY